MASGHERNPNRQCVFVKDTVANVSHSKRGMEKDFLVTSDDPWFECCFYFLCSIYFYT